MVVAMGGIGETGSQVPPSIQKPLISRPGASKRHSCGRAVMAFKPFAKIRVSSQDDISPRNINQFQDNVARCLSQLLGKDSLDQSIVKQQVLQPGLNAVSHTLGRNYQGYVCTRSYGGFPLFYEAAAQPSPNLLVYLMSATTCTVDLLFY